MSNRGFYIRAGALKVPYVFLTNGESRGYLLFSKMLAVVAL